MTRFIKHVTVLVIFFNSLCFIATAQKLTAFFKNDTVRVNSGSAATVDTVLQIVIPKGQDLVNGKIVVSINKGLSSADLKKIKVPLSNEYKIDSLKTDMEVKYAVTVPRNSKDDRTIGFELKAYDSEGKPVVLSDGDTTAVIYVKPQVADSLTTNDSWEFWLFTGTNFDPFDGVKAEEFFFRANTLFKMSNKFYGQIAFYKNRYFTSDSTTNNRIVQPKNPTQVINGTDTTYNYLRGDYQNNIKQKIDPVGVQLDILYKLTGTEIKGNSNFFVSAGFDFSNKTITIENSYSNFDTISFSTKTPMPATSYTIPSYAKSTSYQKPVYNFNVGFMWILDTEDANIKAQLNAGMSHFWEPLYSNPRGGANSIIYQTFSKPFVQVKMYATSKKIGVSFGFESFIRQNEFPQFNFTLSKVFDLRNFLSVLTPVSSLKL